MRLEVLLCPLIDVNVFANAKIGLGVAYTKMAEYELAERAFAEAITRFSASGETFNANQMPCSPSRSA